MCTECLYKREGWEMFMDFLITVSECLEEWTAAENSVFMADLNKVSGFQGEVIATLVAKAVVVFWNSTKLKIQK